MDFTTKIPIEKSNNPISYDSKIIALGSCFAENMAEKFSYFKFQNEVNPFGIIFNPVSIENLVSRVINNQKFTEDDVFFHNDLWHCYEVHSELSHPDKETFLTNLNLIIQQSNNLITQSTHVIITYGTSWVYRNKSSQKIVANCHKVPQSQFDKEILSVEVIEKSIQNTMDLIKKINPNCAFIFTISPVRHVKDGFVENQRSKAHLITAMHEIINYQLSIINYFPSYELMMDELRDYRFYAEDMLHPSQTAIDYIWICFFENYIEEENHALMGEICSIQKALLHRPFNPDSKEHQLFLLSVKEKIDKLQYQFPYIRF
ncbi:GSCFA domain-containing protein [Flavobacterium paronense]|uniref:GSCFA domain-containing protein n=1 Tax=Flavobacterium paronense TaxID=1392775 RepID=A0ABV5GDL3_9FLAO|nr:GSCFA domain-containing protein [Flavobacterium paronense]MDN3678015.1 GSCFA domain-containing protein [Flavobacterium paronense]